MYIHCIITQTGPVHRYINITCTYSATIIQRGPVHRCIRICNSRYRVIEYLDFLTTISISYISHQFVQFVKYLWSDLTMIM